MQHLSAFRGFLLAAALAGGPREAAAQAPARLAGHWQALQISLVANHVVSHALQERMNDSALAVTNFELRHHTLEQVVEFRADGTYRYAQKSKSAPARTETGTYTVGKSVVEAQSPGAAEGSSFARWRIVRLGRRQLVLERPMWADSLRIGQQVEFRRWPPTP
ncbi:hypothetical protein ACFQ48_04365 [Hymenobacter caeli]|uniref:Lipocalin-like domain-containing protein n=1 Tax=Hymenobacter caeli TaxID=2735894 RepID=A0ABX2FQG0_9BACT|nr:hypothetical protein [Hymenobacter caeli]NRT19192.1 hypothetical protein [Hymenobacter caeli]